MTPPPPSLGLGLSLASPLAATGGGPKYRIALAGDSLFGGQYSAAQVASLSAAPRVHTAVEFYSHGRLAVVAPSGYTSFIHALGGTDSGEMSAGGVSWDGDVIIQLDELLTDSASYDTAIVQLGANDVLLPAYDLDTSMANMVVIVTALRAACKRVILQTMIPTNDTGGRAALVLAWNARLASDFGGMTGVSVLDMDPYFESEVTPGTDSGVWGVKDGSHQVDVGSLKNGAVIANLLGPDWRSRDAWNHGVPVTPAPYLATNISGGAIIATGGTISAAYTAREDGETGERFLDITQAHPAQTIGTAANKKITYTCKEGVKCHVWVFAASDGKNSGVDESDITATHYVDLGDGSQLLVIDPARVNTTIVSTAATLAAWVNTNYGDLFTAVADGDGSEKANFGAPGLASIYTSYADNAITPPVGARIRGIVEIRKHPDHAWPIALANMSLTSWAPTSNSLKAYCIQPYISQHLWPEPISDDRIIVASPWYTVAEGQSAWRATLTVGAFGTYRLARPMVQMEI